MFGHYLPLRGKGQSEFADLVYSYVIVQFLGVSSEVVWKFVISVVMINHKFHSRLGGLAGLFTFFSSRRIHKEAR
jgi:hypothetical protein